MGSPSDISVDELRSVAAELGRDTGCRFIALFGSAARSNDRAPEDLDIGVLPGRDAGGLDRVAFTNRLIRALGVQDIDVADLEHADPLLMMIVAREGIPLYESEEGEFARFASLAVRRYADTRKFRAMERREIQDFIDRMKGTA